MKYPTVKLHLEHLKLKNMKQTTAAAPKAQYLDKKFKNNAELQVWLMSMNAKEISLKDNGQDLLKIWVHESGEILYTNAQQNIWIGKFIMMPIPSRGTGVTMYLPYANKGWTKMDFIVKSVKA